jgi:hypothetical protein
MKMKDRILYIKEEKHFSLILILKIKEVEILITSLILPLCCACPKPGFRFQITPVYIQYLLVNDLHVELHFYDAVLLKSPVYYSTPPPPHIAVNLPYFL